SFLEENIRPLVEAGVLRFIEVQEEDTAWLPGFKVRFVYGHTEAMMVPLIECHGQTIVYCADVMPSVHHIGLPYIMAYDLRPLLTLEEKTRILADAHTQNHWLFFEHDLSVPACTVTMDSRQRWVRGETITAERLEAL
ncbi:MAG: MBL fold metallo-hydrolase, partial [Saprospiraceae bacterium]|nr:MBL fold metallo-hydrolase [Saprospiraceae bacterium]